MLDFAVVEIAGRQYKVKPGQKLSVNFLGDVKSLDCDKVLLISEGDKLQIGSPYLKEKLAFDILASTRGKKLRVATYHAKANTRKVKGSRQYNSLVMLKA